MHTQYSKTLCYGEITAEEVMDKLDMFQSRFGELDEFGCWDLERISEYAGTQFTFTEFKEYFCL